MIAPAADWQSSRRLGQRYRGFQR